MVTHLFMLDYIFKENIDKDHFINIILFATSGFDVFLDVNQEVF